MRERREEDHDECNDEYDGGDDDEVIGGSTQTIATRKLATRLHSAGIPYAYAGRVRAVTGPMTSAIKIRPMLDNTLV